MSSCSDLFNFFADIAGTGQDFCAPEVGQRLTVVQGNTVEIFLTISVQGVVVTDLAAATVGRFQAIGHRDNAVGVTKTYPGGFTIDDPTPGTSHIILDATETDLLLGEYDLSLEFEWVDRKLEWMFDKTLNIRRDDILFEL